MKDKHFLLSKRFWGFVLLFIGHFIPMIFPENEQAVILSNWLTEIGMAVFGLGTVTAKEPLRFPFLKKIAPCFFIVFTFAGNSVFAQPVANNTGDSLVPIDRIYWDVTSRQIIFSQFGSGTEAAPTQVKRLGAPLINTSYFPLYTLSDSTLTNVDDVAPSRKVGSSATVRSKYYEGLLTQTGTANPVIIRLDSNFVGAVQSVRDSIGYYRVTSDSSEFSAGKTAVQITNTDMAAVGVRWVSTSTINVHVKVGGDPKDAFLDSTAFFIRVFP